jgi:hypothetical protein
MESVLPGFVRGCVRPQILCITVSIGLWALTVGVIAYAADDLTKPLRVTEDGHFLDAA